MGSGLVGSEFPGHKLSEQLRSANFGAVGVERAKRSFDLPAGDSDMKNEGVAATINRELKLHGQSCLLPELLPPSVYSTDRAEKNPCKSTTYKGFIFWRSGRDSIPRPP